MVDTDYSELRYEPSTTRDTTPDYGDWKRELEKQRRSNLPWKPDDLHKFPPPPTSNPDPNLSNEIERLKAENFTLKMEVQAIGYELSNLRLEIAELLEHFKSNKKHKLHE